MIRYTLGLFTGVAVILVLGACGKMQVRYGKGYAAGIKMRGKQIVLIKDAVQKHGLR